VNRFRASPHIELKQLGDLTPEERAPFLELENDPEFYGLFTAKPPLSMNLKAVSRAAATLFRTLSTPSTVDDEESVVDLLLDGIVEVESGDGFVSGADALPLVADRVRAPEADDAVARLSRDALLHAQDLETSDPAALTTALYLYGRIPLSPFWQARFPDAEAVLAHLGADRGPLRALLDREWLAPHHIPSWVSWESKSERGRGGDVAYKLYVSPRPERIRDAFAITVRVLADFPGTPFKIGNDAVGLLRPDKLVAYFPTRGELRDVAAALQRELAGCDAHGVPFSAGLDASGLLSWSIDPPDKERPLHWLDRDSWRSWLARHLASALAVAKAARTASAVEPWLFAVERARRHGVDVETWTPSAALWS
jgi:hypothetical protein